MSGETIVIGVDLSGPSNGADTAASCFRAEGDPCFRASGRLTPLEQAQGLDDPALLAFAARLGSRARLVIGLDAPLSYNPGGGDRPADRELRRAVVSAGLQSGSVMTPTMTRMAYLTLRGIAVARGLAQVCPQAQIVECHPGAVMALRGACVDDVVAFKHDAAARARLVAWVAGKFLDAPLAVPETDHMLAAHACAVGAWRWSLGESVWITRADPPLHPFDFAV